jgi:uncharacterized protein YjiS (DUF1127 family)
MTSLALRNGPHYSGSAFPPVGDWAVTCARYLLSIAIGKEIAMSSKQHRNLQATPAGVDALESLQHMTTWARQTVTSPEAAPMQSRYAEKTFASSLVDCFALGATAFHPGPWIAPLDGLSEAGLARELAREAQPGRPWIGVRALKAIGGAAVRFFRYVRERREVSRATAMLSEMDDRSLRDIGLSRSDIGRAVRHGRDWGPWH